MTGGIFRYGPIDVRPQVDAGTSDGADPSAKFGDANLSTFATPGPSSTIRGLHEATVVSRQWRQLHGDAPRQRG